MNLNFLGLTWWIVQKSVCVCVCVSSACTQEAINEGLQYTGQWKAGCYAWEQEQDRRRE